MPRTLLATSILVVGTFVTGLVVGQVGGANPAFAAGKSHQNLKATKKAKTAKVKKSTKAKATKKQTSATTGAQHADGQITAIDSTGTVITVKPDADKAGSNEYTTVTTIKLTGTTQYEAGRGAAATTTKPAIAVGQYIVAEGSVSGTTLTATLVSVHAAGGH